MSMKPYVIRGKTSPEWTSYDFSPDYRNRSAQRGYATGRTSPYKSEFDLDGSLHRRSTFYSPPRLSPRSSRAYLAAKAAALGFPRSGGVSDWSRDTGSPSMSRSHNLSPQLPPYRPARSSEVGSPQANRGRRENGNNGGVSLGSGASPNVDETRHRDLKRKMVFDLHKEINKSTHTTHLEEISDMDKITDICFSNLRLMMENKKHRKYLHHMNNNALVMSCLLLEETSLNSLDTTNNSGFEQVASLEKCIREKGQDPGIHVHMDVSNYDVFSEIRRIRRAQNAGTTFEVYPYDEEDEENIAQDKLKSELPPPKLANTPPSIASTRSSFKSKKAKLVGSVKTKQLKF